jgi:hypothetical protein
MYNTTQLLNQKVYDTKLILDLFILTPARFP